MMMMMMMIIIIIIEDLTHIRTSRALYFSHPTHFINVINLVNLFRKKLTWNNLYRGDERKEKRRNGEGKKKIFLNDKNISHCLVFCVKTTFRKPILLPSSG